MAQCTELRSNSSRCQSPASRFDSRRRSDLAGPVIDVILGVGHVPQTWAVGADLPRIGVLANLGGHHRADRQVTKLCVGIVDDLMRCLGTARGTADDVAG